MMLAANYVHRTIFVPENAYARIIGRGGDTIKRLEVSRQVSIKLNRIDGSLSVKGVTNAAVDQTLHEIEQMIYSMECGRRNYSPRQNIQKSDSSTNREVSTKSPPKEEKKTPPKENQVAGEDAPTFDWESAYRQFKEERKKMWDEYPAVKKDFYEEDPTIAALTDAEVMQIRKDLGNISVEIIKNNNELSGQEISIPSPIQTFEQCFAKYPQILHELRRNGFTKPSPIQCQSWPILLSGRDMIGIAQTGTGKTLAFILPALIHVSYRLTQLPPGANSLVLVLTPTRELAQQVHREVEKYPFMGIKS